MGTPTQNRVAVGIRKQSPIPSTRPGIHAGEDLGGGEKQKGMGPHTTCHVAAGTPLPPTACQIRGVGVDGRDGGGVRPPARPGPRPRLAPRPGPRRRYGRAAAAAAHFPSVLGICLSRPPPSWREGRGWRALSARIRGHLTLFLFVAMYCHCSGLARSRTTRTVVGLLLDQNRRWRRSGALRAVGGPRHPRGRRGHRGLRDPPPHGPPPPRPGPRPRGANGHRPRRRPQRAEPPAPAGRSGGCGPPLPIPPTFPRNCKT